MASPSEKTFGNQLEKANQILAITENANDFTPPDENIKASNFRQFLGEVAAKNDTVRDAGLILNEKRNARYNAYYGGGIYTC